jgi:tRNA(Ile)-lysidine synthase
VAVSGGADSMALLTALYQLRSQYALTLLVAHVDHQLRDLEARQDALFVQQQAQRLGLPFYQTRIDVRARQRGSRLSPQQAARQARYAYLTALQHETHATHIALGHTADDQAETLLLRLLRGTGPTGLAGMPAVRLPYIRPLITTSRRTVLAWLRSEGIPWVYDRSNARRSYLRNRIRLDLMPTLRQYNPRIAEHLSDLADMLRADHAWLEQQTLALAEQVVQWRPGPRVRLRCEPYREAPLALQRRLLRWLFDRLLASPTAAGFGHVEALRQFLSTGQSGSRLSLPGRLLAEYQRGIVWLWSTREAVPPGQVFPLEVPGSTTIPALALRCTAYILPPPATLPAGGQRWAWLDRQRLRLPLAIRCPRPGDRFHPLGAPGRKKLTKFLMEHQVPRAERAWVPLVVCGDAIVWVVGYGIADAFRVRPATRSVVRLHYTFLEGQVS